MHVDFAGIEHIASFFVLFHKKIFFEYAQIIFTSFMFFEKDLRIVFSVFKSLVYRIDYRLSVYDFFWL